LFYLTFTFTTMPRTNEAKIRKIIEVDSTEYPEGDLQPFIDAASSLVDEKCASVLSYTEERLTMIETWLAAHFFAVGSTRAQSESAGPVSQSKQTSLGLNLQVTHWGQQAMLLDTEGGLANLNVKTQEGRKSKAGIFWAGKE
jgi:hypothetical protein